MLEESHNRHNANIVLMSHGYWAQFSISSSAKLLDRRPRKNISIFIAPNRHNFSSLDLLRLIEIENVDGEKKKLRDLLQIRHELKSLFYSIEKLFLRLGSNRENDNEIYAITSVSLLFPAVFNKISVLLSEKKGLGHCVKSCRKCCIFLLFLLPPWLPLLLPFLQLFVISFNEF